jgi:sterol desaturase/sphingolipid hydroxylase (fatty acid hydroxylase superfamily)
MGSVILMAIPIFFLLIGLEVWIDHRRGTGAYRLSDALSSLSIGGLSQITGFYSKAVVILLYGLAFDHLAVIALPAGDWRVWGAAVLIYDFCYYWNHRCGHEMAILWAAHVTHHSSEQYNLTTALRQSSTGFLLSWIFYLPMALIGIPPALFIAAGLINLLYQYWIHTRHIGGLGWFDTIFASPSNHRVHHGQNDYCIDRNYGGILMLWDHLFGSFAAEREDEPIIYGIRGQLASYDPLRANLHLYGELARHVGRAQSWRERAALLVGPPGGRGAKKVWSPGEFRPFEPERPRLGAKAAFLLFLPLMGASIAWLATAPSVPALTALAGAAILTGAYRLFGQGLS